MSTQGVSNGTQNGKIPYAFVSHMYINMQRQMAKNTYLRGQKDKKVGLFLHLDLELRKIESSTKQKH